MSWKFIGCQGLVIIGIVLLASLNSSGISDRMYVLRVVVIVVLSVFLFRLNFQSYWKPKKKMKQQEQILASSVEEMKIELRCMTGDIQKLKDDIKQLESKPTEPLDSNRASVKDFYNFLLIKWAQEKNAPFTGKNYKDIEEQFEKYQKQTVKHI